MAVKKCNILCLPALFILLAFCNNVKELSPVDFVKWVENKDNGLCTERVLREFKFTLQYKPIEYIALKELRSINPGKAEFDKTFNEIEGSHYFTLRVGVNEQNATPLSYLSISESEHNRILEYFSYTMKNDFELIEGNDTIPCSLYAFENEAPTPFNTFVLAFENRQTNTKYLNDMTFIYHDKILGTGTVKMVIKESDLKTIPKLKLY